MRWLAYGVVAVVIAAALAGCSSTDEAPGGEKRGMGSEGRTSLQQRGAWLMAWQVETPDGEDVRVYASFHPVSGKLTPHADGRRPPVEGGRGNLDDKHPQLVSADARWYRDQVLVQDGEDDTGVIELHGLLGGSRSIDLRKLTGDIRLEPTQAVFDGGDPHLLHVFSRDGDIYAVDLSKNTSRKRGKTPDHNAESENLVFDPSGTGKVLTVQVVEDADGKVVTPHVPNPDHVTARPGGEVVDESDYPDLPDADYSLFKTKDGTVWALGVEGDERAFVRAYRIPQGADDWERMPGEAPWNMAGTPEEVDWIRPPLD